MKGQSFWFSDAKDLGEIPTGSPQTGAPNRGVGRLKWRFSTNIWLYLTNGAKIQT